MARGLEGVVADEAAVQRGEDARAAGTSSGLPLILLRYPPGRNFCMQTLLRWHHVHFREGCTVNGT